MHDKINNNKDDPWFRDEKLMNFLKKTIKTVLLAIKAVDLY